MEQLGSRATFWRFCVITSVESREGDLSCLNTNFLCFAKRNQNKKNMNMFQKETAKSLTRVVHNLGLGLSVVT